MKLVVMKKSVYFLFILLIGFSSANAQIGPYVAGFDKKLTTVNDTVVISGINFPQNLSDVLVHFGNGEAVVTSTSESTIKALVPTTATFGPVKVTDLQKIITLGDVGPDSTSIETIHRRNSILSCFPELCTSKNKFGRSLHVEMILRDFDKLQLPITKSVKLTSIVALSARTGVF